MKTSIQHLVTGTAACILFLFASGCATTPSSPQAATDAIHSETLVRISKSWDGATLPAYPAGQPEVRLLRITIPAGAKLPLHKHPVINVGLMTKGQLTVVTESGQQNQLQAGDTIVEVVETWHYGMNNGSEPAEILVFYAGTEDLPITQLADQADQQAAEQIYGTE
jgi:quercetin dioxygenase-like cupin family protein